VRLPPPSFLRLQNASRRHDHLLILAEGDRVAGQLRQLPDPDAEVAGWIAETALVLGVAHAAYERAEAASSYLAFGLAAANAATESGARRPDPTSSPRLARRSSAAPVAVDAALTDRCEVLLLELQLSTGAFEAAAARLPTLLEPTRPTAVRFAATRTQAALASIRGDDEAAHFLLNTATGLAQRLPSRMQVAFVEGDRSIVLANQGRRREAVAIADRLLASFVRPAVGAAQRWSNAEAAAVALTLSRLCAVEGDTLTAQRLLNLGRQAAAPLDLASLRAQASLAAGVALAAEGDIAGSEQALLDAHSTFTTYGYLPASAITTLEQGRAAHRRGLVRSARPLYDRAIDELRSLGMPRETRQCRRLIDALDAGRPPLVEEQPSGPARFPSPRPRF
jgi:hypothetical protein